MKRFLGLILTLSLLLCLWGCGTKTEPTVPTSETTEGALEAAPIQGTVLAITETSLTVQTEAGEQTFALTDSTLYYQSFGRGDFRPDATMPNMGQQPPEPPVDGQQPPEMPVDGQQPPTESEGSVSGGFTPGNGIQGGSAPLDRPEGEGSFDQGGRPDSREPRVITRNEVAVGDQVSLTLDEKGAVLTLTVEGGQPPVPPVTEATTQQ